METKNIGRRTFALVAGIAIALGAMAPAALAGTAATAPSHASARVMSAAEDPPPGYVYYPGHTYDNWLACQAAGLAGLLQWEGYRCLQTSWGAWSLWVHPWFPESE
jgi:hypothetical protein